jgi:hypothetical protein
MATVIGGIGTSHAPAIGVAWDKGQQREPMWAPLFDGYGRHGNGWRRSGRIYS